MDNKQGVLLVLKTSDLVVEQSKNSTNSNFIWNNIYLKKLLGNMWDEYEYFNLKLVSINSGNQQSNAIQPTNVINRPNGFYNVLNVNMEGFDFVEYDTRRKQNNSKVIYSITNDQLSNILICNSNILTFCKSKEVININIFFTTLNENFNTLNSLVAYLLSVNRGYFDRVFIFRITGVKLEEDINLERRLF